MPDANGVLNKVLTTSGSSVVLRTSVVSASSVRPTAHTKNANGVWNAVFDRATNSIRVVVV